MCSNYSILQDYAYFFHITQHYKIMHNVFKLLNTTRLRILFSYYAILQDYAYCVHIMQHYKIIILFSYCTIITTFYKTNWVSSKHSGRESLHSFLCPVEHHAMKMYEKEEKYLYAFLNSSSRRTTVSFMPGLLQTWVISLYFRTA